MAVHFFAWWPTLIATKPLWTNTAHLLWYVRPKNTQNRTLTSRLYDVIIHGCYPCSQISGDIRLRQISLWTTRRQNIKQTKSLWGEKEHRPVVKAVPTRLGYQSPRHRVAHHSDYCTILCLNPERHDNSSPKHGHTWSWRQSTLNNTSPKQRFGVFLFTSFGCCHVYIYVKARCTRHARQQFFSSKSNISLYIG